MSRSVRRGPRQAALPRPARNEKDSVSEGSGAGSMEAAEQQLPGVEDRDKVPADRHALDAPAANMQTAVRRGRRGSRAPLPAPVSQAGYTNLPAQSPDALAVASVLPLIGLVHSQDAASLMTQAELDRWHQHGRLFTSSLKIACFGEVPMIADAQQKLLL